LAPAEVAQSKIRWHAENERRRNAAADPLGPILQDYHVTPYAAWHFEETTARSALQEHFGTASLEGYGCEDKPLAIAAAAFWQYLQTQKGLLQLAGLRTTA
jgi:DNA mismatch repair ATPase MutS